MTNKRKAKKAPAEAGAGVPQHPSIVRKNKLERDPVAPFSVEEQWKQVEDWHAFLESEAASNYPLLDGYNHLWQMLDSDYAGDGKSYIKRGADLRRESDTPLALLFYFFGVGIYPPPELLLTLRDCWETYMASGGQLSLEEAFHGKLKKGVGNYVSRKKASSKRADMESDFASLLEQGLPNMAAANALSQIYGSKADPESILRTFRGVKPKKGRITLKKTEK